MTWVGGSTQVVVFVSHLQSQACLWTPHCFFSTHSEWKTSGPWGDIHWIWLYLIIIIDYTFKGNDISFSLWMMGSYIKTNIFWRVSKTEQFCFISQEISVFLFLSYYWFEVGGAQLGKIWCHVLLCTNQSSATYESKCVDRCGIVSVCMSLWSNNTHTVLMKQISWDFDCFNSFNFYSTTYLVVNIWFFCFREIFMIWNRVFGGFKIVF